LGDFLGDFLGVFPPHSSGHPISVSDVGHKMASSRLEQILSLVWNLHQNYVYTQTNIFLRTTRVTRWVCEKIARNVVQSIWPHQI
jgi:hypothetical protein